MNPAGFLDFCWSDAAGAGLSRYNLASGEEGNFLRNFFTPDLLVSVRNGISFTGVGAYVSLSSPLADCPALYVLPVNRDHTIAHRALDGRFIITVELDTQKVKGGSRHDVIEHVHLN
jgi:hypothetical protein